MDKYTCDICGYIYYVNDGDPNREIPSGTPFEELPDDWVCPVCGADKKMFQL